MASRVYVEEVKKRLEPEPDLSRLLTYDEIAARYGERFRALGLKGDAAGISGTLRSLVSRRVLRRWEQAGRTKLYAGDIEVYLTVLEEPRPVA